MKAMRLLYEDKKDRYWRNEIANSKGNMQRLWRTLHSALGETSGGETGDHTADEFASFFTDKVVDRSTAVMMEEDNKLYFLHSTTTPYLAAYYIGNRHTHTCNSKYVSISISDETTTQHPHLISSQCPA